MAKVDKVRHYKVQDVFTVPFDKDTLLQKTVDEKLIYLIEIAFSNHRDIVMVRDMVMGNGDDGLCDMMQNHELTLKWMWITIGALCTAFTGAASTITYVLIKHVVG